MKFLTAIILIGFIGITLLGFTGMSNPNMGDHMNRSCLASFLDSDFCLPSAFSVAIHHISALQSFSNVPISSLYFSLIFLVLLAFATTVLFKSIFEVNQIFSFEFANYPIRLAGSARRKIIHWLSLFENSPTKY